MDINKIKAGKKRRSAKETFKAKENEYRRLKTKTLFYNGYGHMAQLNLNFYESYVDSPDGTENEESKELNQHRLRIFDIREETKGLTNSQI